MLLSICIPFYNAADFLPDFIHSLCSQDLTDCEVLFCNDGSADHSVSLLLELIGDTSNIRLLNCGHKGVAAARNYLISQATGEYLYFCDADDTLKPDCIQTIRSTLQHTACPVFIFGYETEKKQERTPYCYDKNFFCSPYEALCAVLNDNRIDGFLWNKVYRRSVLQGISFHEDLSLCEDLLFQVELFLTIKESVYVLSDCLYTYRQTPNSLSTKSFTQSGSFAYAAPFQMIRNTLIFNSNTCFDITKSQRKHAISLLNDHYLSILVYSKYCVKAEKKGTKAVKSELKKQFRSLLIPVLFQSSFPPRKKLMLIKNCILF